jgi:hypothetical protein
VFGVKDSLIVDFTRHESEADGRKYGRKPPFYTAEYDFALVPGSTKHDVKFSAGRAE